MQFSPAEVDDICVASLLYDIGSIEVTTRVLCRAIDTLDGETPAARPNTFQGLDLMLSLGSVLRGAIPLLLSQNRAVSARATTGQNAFEVPLGAEVIRTARAYCDLTAGGFDQIGLSPTEAIQSLRCNGSAAHNPKVLNALNAVVAAQGKNNARTDLAGATTTLEPAALN